MKYVVLGAGLQGPAVAYGLAKLRPNEQVWLIEKDKPRMDRAKWLLEKKLNIQNIVFLKVGDNIPVLDPFLKETDVTVVSTLPFTMNHGIAIQCMKHGWRYYDLGGHIQTSEKISLTAVSQGSSVPVMTDLGLAPGLVNVLGEYAITQLPNPQGLQMMCGGLPVDPTLNELNYGVTFSPEGLINEYFNDCHQLIDGKVQKVEPMGDHCTVTMGEEYEAFNTSGGAHTTLEAARQKGLRFCAYKTIRHFGHCKIMRFLKNDIGMTNDQLIKLVKEKVPRISQDKVLIGIKVFNDIGANYMMNYEILFDENFTAMQKGTGFSVAGMVVCTEHILDKPLLSYEDIDAKKLLEQIGKLLPEVEL